VPLRPLHLIADPAVEVGAAESEESGRATALGAAVNADEQVGNELRHEILLDGAVKGMTSGRDQNSSVRVAR
jgi:hypothetical protein